MSRNPDTPLVTRDTVFGFYRFKRDGSRVAQFRTDGFNQQCWPGQYMGCEALVTESLQLGIDTRNWQTHPLR